MFKFKITLDGHNPDNPLFSIPSTFKVIKFINRLIQNLSNRLVCWRTNCLWLTHFYLIKSSAEVLAQAVHKTLGETPNSSLMI